MQTPTVGNPSLRLPMLIAGLGLALGACASNRLHEFDYRDRTLAVVSAIPRRPEILTGPLFPSRSGDPVRDILRTGASVAREIEARAVRERLDSAAARVDVGYILEDALLERAARYLGARPAEGDEAGEYLLDLVVVEYGIDAEDWDATAYFYIEADAVLLEAASGTEIWSAEIGADDPIGPEIWGGRAVRNAVTAGVLADLSTEEIVVALESLAAYSARVITDRLRDDLRDARNRLP